MERAHLPISGYGVKAFTLAMVKAAVAVTDAAVPAGVVDELVDTGLAMLTETVRLLPDVPAVLADLSRDHRLVLITKGDLVHQTRKVETSGLAHHFEQIEVVLEKDPATYERILRQVGVAPARFCMVGNSVRSDILPVLALGGHAVHIPYPLLWEHEHVDHDEDLDELASIKELPGGVASERMIVGMDPDRLLGALRRDAAALLEAVRAAGPDAPVPSCPGWTAIDLAWHIGEVHEFWGTIVADRLDAPDGYVQSPRPETFDDTVTFAESTAAVLLDALQSTDPATPVWTWGSDRTAGFVLRRMAHETAVHRLDAERAAGREHTIDADLASDGVDEFLFEFLAWVADDAAAARRLGAPALHRRRR